MTPGQRERHNAGKRAWYAANREKVLAQEARWREVHREEKRERDREYDRERRPERREANAARQRAWKARQPRPFRLKVVRWKPPKPKPFRLKIVHWKPIVRRWTMGWCPECGGPFVTTRPVVRFCSQVCRKRSERRYSRARRRAARRSGEPVKHAVVAKRDNWLCHLCGGLVTREDWSLDHLVPIAHGGSHTYDNVALAHFLCNSKRGAKELENVA